MLKRVPVCWRLTLWYGSALAVVLAGFGAAIYALTSYHMLAAVDAALGEELVEFRAEIERAGDASQLHRELGIRFTGHEGFEFQALASDGRVVFRSKRVATAGIPRLEREASQAAPEFRSLTVPSFGSVRVVEQGVASHAGPLAAQAMVSLRPYEQALGELLTVMWLIGPLALAVSSAIGYFLAKQALAPVDRMAAAAREITARRLDQRLDNSPCSDELQRLAETFNGMLDRLEASFAEIRKFAADAAHEFRTPLAVMRNEADVALLATRSPEQYQQVLESQLEEIDRLTRLANELLFLCRQDAEQQTLCEPVAMHELLGELMESAEGFLVQRTLAVEISVSESAYVRGDRAKLWRVLINLFDNAVKYTPDGGSIRLSLRAGESVQFAIADSGIGIPQADLPRVFDRFFRSDSARVHGAPGSGIGLSICQAIIQAHGGTIHIDSMAGAGTTVTVSLPATGDPTPANARASHSNAA